MWNKRLNEKFTNRLIGFCQGKRVIIVGNAISMFANEYGDFIDSFDVVVRMGKGFPYPEFKKQLGSKTNVWMLSVLRHNHHKQFKDAEYKVLNISQIGLYENDRGNISIPKSFFVSDDFQIYKDYFLIGNLPETQRLIKRVYGVVDKEQRSSQGGIAISYFTEVIKSYKELHVIGFDFFDTKFQYKLNDEINEVSSFHLPIPSFKGTNSNPHKNLYESNPGNKEKIFVDSLIQNNKIVFHEIKNRQLSPEATKLIMDRYRPTGEPI